MDIEQPDVRAATGTREVSRALLGLNLANRLDRLPVCRWHYRVFLGIAGAFFVDSVDLGALTFVLQPISHEFDLTKVEAGLLGTSSYIGMFFGASIAGNLADRFGRRSVFQWSMVLWGVASLLLVFAGNYGSLMALRFFVGAGMGAEFPIAQSLMSEFAPTRVRGRFIAFMEGGWPFGFVIAGALSIFLIPRYGWRSMYIAIFVLSLFVFVVRWVVPESPRWQAVRGRFDSAEVTMTAIEAHIERATGRPLAEPAAASIVEEVTARSALSELWNHYRVRIIMICTIWFVALFGYYGITTWLSKLLVANGMKVSSSIEYVTLISLWGIPAFVVVGLVQERIGRRNVLAGALVCTAVSAYFYGQATGTGALIVAGSFMQFFAFSMWAVLYTYTAEIFPTKARAGGCGFASATGRLGAALGPYVVPLVLAAGGNNMVFVMAAAAYALAAAIVLIVGPETKQRTLEEIAT